MIILTGVPGAGKSSQGKLLAANRNLNWLSTGEILRVQASPAQKEIMLSGGLLGDDDMIELVSKAFSETNSDRIILDGFPRSPAQVEWLIGEARSGRVSISGVVHITVSKTEAVARLMNRGRADDDESVIATRFDEYDKAIQPVLDAFRAGGFVVIEVDGGYSPEQVHRDIIAKIDALEKA